MKTVSSNDLVDLRSGVQRCGKFEPESGNVEIHERAGPDVEDPLDQSAVQTFLTGGEVFAVNPAEVPGDGTLAAVFRY